MRLYDARLLGDRLAAWLVESRRAEASELCAGVLARTARLGDHMVIHEVGYRQHDLLLVVNARTGDLAFALERYPPSGEDTTIIADSFALAAVRADLDAVNSVGVVH